MPDQSTDPDGEEDIVRYDWDFDGDSTVDATGITVTHSYNDGGTYDVTLTVYDTKDNSGSSVLPVSVFDASAPPTADVGIHKLPGDLSGHTGRAGVV